MKVKVYIEYIKRGTCALYYESNNLKVCPLNFDSHDIAKEYIDANNLELVIKHTNNMNQEIPVSNENETTKPEFSAKEFVIDVKNLNIKEEIKNATVGFTKLYVEANLEKALSAIVAEEVKKLTPNYIKIGERKQIKIEGRLHKAFEDVTFLAQQHGQVFISGPAGSGKTTLGEQVAKAFGLKFAHISCSAGISEAHLLGRMLFNGEYVSSDFVEIYENGGVFLADEIDAADANTLLILNSGLANGYISVPNRKGKTHAKRHKDFFLVASANTWGNGSFEYHGRNHLDAAFMDRFTMSKVSVGYDKTVEKEYCASCMELANVLWKIRANCEKNKVRKIVSTRAFKEGALQIAAGKTLKEVVSRFVTGWSKEEIAKVVPEGNLEDVQEEQEVEAEGAAF